MNRRSFIYRASGITICLPALARKPALPYMDRIGLQLYTLRNPIKEDLGKTIQEVAKIGYKQVEPFGFPSPQAIDLITQSRDHGMQVNSSHFDWNSLLAPSKKGVQPFEKILETARKHKLTDLVVPYLHEVDQTDLNAYEKTAETLSKGAALAKKAGIRLAYHNHAFEFKPMHKGKRAMACSSNPFPPTCFLKSTSFG